MSVWNLFRNVMLKLGNQDAGDTSLPTRSTDVVAAHGEKDWAVTYHTWEHKSI